MTEPINIYPTGRAFVTLKGEPVYEYTDRLFYVGLLPQHPRTHGIQVACEVWSEAKEYHKTVTRINV